MTRRDPISAEIRARIMRRASAHPSTCWTGKIQHPSENEARKAIRGLRRRQDPDIEGLVPFKCPDCRRWHTGHGLGKDP